MMTLLQEIEDGQGVPLRELGARCPMRKISIRTLFRWIKDGVPTPNGPVRLEAALFGGQWVSTQAALIRLFQRQNRASLEVLGKRSDTSKKVKRRMSPMTAIAMFGRYKNLSSRRS
jgi:hypothetical protein